MIAVNPARSEDRSAWHGVQAVLAALWKRRWRAVVVFVAVMAAVVGGLVICPRVYQSEARLFVRVGRESIGLDPTATTGQTISVSDSREFEMNSVVDLISSRAALERVVDRLGPEFVLLGGEPRPVSPAATTASGAPVDYEAGLRRDKAIRALDSAIKTASGKRTSVISVSCRADKPERAQLILKTFLEEFHALHVAASRASGSREFFDEQVRVLSAQLAAATTELSAAKDAVGMVWVEGRQKSLEDQMAAIQTAAVKNATTLAATAAEIDALSKSMESLPERRITQEVSGFPDGASGAARKHLNELKLREQELLAKFTRLHPNVIAVEEQIARAEQLLAQQDADAHQQTKLANPTREALHLRLLQDEALAASLRAEARSLDQEKQKLQRELTALNANDGRVTALQQRVDVLKASLRAYTEKLEQSRIDQALAADQISNVSVVQPASYMPKPVSPKKTLVILAGFVVAAITGLAAALAAEFRPSDFVRPPTARVVAPALEPTLTR